VTRADRGDRIQHLITLVSVAVFISLSSVLLCAEDSTFCRRRVDAESGEPHAAGVVAWFQRDEHVFRLDVFMDQTALVDVAERRCHTNRRSQEPRHIDCLRPVPIENAVERFAARVDENKNGPFFVACERQRFGRPRWLKFGRKRVFVLKASQTLEQRLFRGRSHDQKGHVVAALSGAVRGEFRAIADSLQHVLRRCCHLRAHSSPGGALQNVNRPAS